MSTARVTFKVSYNGDMHRFSISEKDATIDELNKFIKEAFELNDMNKFKKKYEDPEGDLITLKTNFDLEEAIRVSLLSKKAIRLNLITEDDEQIETNNMQEETSEYDSKSSNETNNVEQSEVDQNNSKTSQGSSVTSEEASSDDSTADSSDPLKSFMYHLGKTSLQSIEETLEQSQKAVEDILDTIFGQSSKKREFRSPENKHNRFKREYNNSDIRTSSESNSYSNDGENDSKPIEDKEDVIDNYQYRGNYSNEFEQLKQMGFPPDLSADVLESCKGDIVETIETLAKMRI